MSNRRRLTPPLNERLLPPWEPSRPAAAKLMNAFMASGVLNNDDGTFWDRVLLDRARLGGNVNIEEQSHRDYWFVTLDNNVTLVVSRDSKSGVVLVSAMTNENGEPAMTQPTEAHFNPLDLSVGTVMGTSEDDLHTVTKVTYLPRLAVTGRRTS